MSANGYGIIAVTGRAHCQRDVAFFEIWISNDFLVTCTGGRIDGDGEGSILGVNHINY